MTDRNPMPKHTLTDQDLARWEAEARRLVEEDAIDMRLDPGDVLDLIAEVREHRARQQPAS